MKFGINTLLWTANFDRPHLDLLPQFKQHGFDGVEVARFEFNTFPAAEVRRALEQNGLEATFCSALTGTTSLVSDNADTRRQAREYLMAGIQAAAEIGASTLAGPFCSPVGYLPGRRRNADEWKLAVEGLQSLTPTLEQYNVTMAVEPLNRFETYFLNTVADAVSLCREVSHPRVRILFDTFHANIEEKSVADALRAAAPYLGHVHTCENDRGAPGSGHVDWNGVFSALHELKYDRWLVIESFGSRIPEIAAAACIWRDLASSPEALAYDGLAFLKQHT
jgi:D-psicose/D-tagatose/L-ribulose 3-epimerase